MKVFYSVKALLLVAAMALPPCATAAEPDFLREMARTDGDFQGNGATVATDASREPATPMTREDIAFLQELARPDGLGTVEPMEASSGTAVATR